MSKSVPLILTLVFGSLLSTAASRVSWVWEVESEKVRFLDDVHLHTEFRRQLITSALEAVESLKALYLASEEVTRAEFQRFTDVELEDVELEGRRGVQALEWIPRVKAAHRAAFEAAARQDGHKGFTFTERGRSGELVTAAERPEYFPVYFIAPYRGNEAALGFDLASNPIRLEALERSRDSGELKASERITLVQESGESFGFLVFQPIYRPDTATDTVEDRRRNLAGFAVAVLRVDDFATAPPSPEGAGTTEIDIFIFDESAPAERQLLYPADAPFQTLTDLPFANCAIVREVLGGRAWAVAHCPTGSSAFWPGHFQSMLILIMGLVVTGISSVYLRAVLIGGRIAAELRVSEARYRDIVDGAAVLIQSVNPEDGRFLFTNNAWREALGYGAEDVPSLTIFDIIHADSIDHCMKVLGDLQPGRSAVSIEAIFVSKDGRQIDVEGSVVMRQEADGTKQTHGVFTDVTKRKTAEELSSRLAQELTTLIDTANVPILGVDTDGRINEWNRMAERITGYKKEEVIERHLVKGFVAGENQQSVQDVLDRGLKGNETSNYELVLLTKEGKRVDILLNSTTRRDVQGRIVGVVGFGQDITGRKQTEVQLIQAAKLATLGEMATSVAHELSQPLNVIRMAAGNVARMLQKKTVEPAYLAEKLDRIDKQTARAASIIDHMRMFGRKPEAKLRKLDARDMVAGVLGLMGEQLRLGEIEIVTNLPQEGAFVMGDVIQLEQVLLNLLTNAKDVLEARDGKKKITLSVLRGDGKIQLLCEDNGGGIREDVISRVFEPFFTTKAIGKGTGLGLSISYGIIRDMGGTIEAENAGGGARITITLPEAG